MGRSCFVDNSPHREEYDRLRLEGKPIKYITELAHSKYNETNLEYHHFQKHFANHVESLVTEAVKANRLRDEVVKEVVKKDIEIIKTFSSNLQSVTDQVSILVKEMGNIQGIEKYGELLVKLVAESRAIIEQYLKWSTKLNIQDTSEDMFNIIIKCMHDFPPDLLSKFADRWKELNE